MKQQDIAMILVVAGIAGIFSLIIANLVIGGGERVTEVEVVKPISAEFNFPDERFFNVESINPTRTVEIGRSPNPTPFGADNPAPPTEQ